MLNIQSAATASANAKYFEVRNVFKFEQLFIVTAEIIHLGTVCIRTFQVKKKKKRNTRKYKKKNRNKLFKFVLTL